MKFYRLLTTTLLVTIFVSTSCSKDSVQPSSSPAGALTANSAFSSLAARPFGRQYLNAIGFHVLNEFIRPEVRSRMDEEPVGDTDGGYDASALDPGTSTEQTQAENPTEGQNEESQPNQGSTEDLNQPAGDSFKFSWAKKSFGEAIKANPTAGGVIVLYADDNYYEVDRLMGFVEEGRNRVAKTSGIEGDRIQVVFGGYRAVPQVELWVLPQGAALPEFKTDERAKPAQSEN